MAFSNPAGQAESGAEAYIRALLELLGEQDPLAVQAATPERLRQRMRGLDAAQLARPEAPGKWSIAEVLWHLADNELVHTVRMRKILAEDEPDLEGYDQDRWARQLDYRQQDAAVGLEFFSGLRQANLYMLRGLSAAAWQRWGRHRERGQETVRRTCQLIAAHDLVHLRQLDRIREALSAPSAG
jgi:uncharacterized damage-inducible protein DinB